MQMDTTRGATARLSLPVAALVLVTLATVAPGRASADDAARQVALILEPARRADAGRVGQLTNLIVAALEKRGIARARLIGPFDRMSLERGRQTLAEARAMLATDHRLQRAAEEERLLMGALLALKGALGAVDRAELIEAYRGLAATRLAQSDRRLASDYLLAAIHLNPDAPERELFGNTDLRGLYRQLKSSYVMLGVSEVRVETIPPGAEVYVGDTLRGYTPLAVNGLKEGTQLIRVKSDGFYSHGWLTDLRTGSNLTLSHRLRPMGGRARLEGWLRTLRNPRSWRRPAGIQGAVAGVRRLLGTEDIVVAAVRRTRDAYVIHGTSAPAGKEPVPVDLSIPVNADLLQRVSVLTYEWYP